MMSKIIKTLLFIIIGVSFIILSSCTKEQYTFCNITYDGYLDTSNYVIIEYNRKEAKEKNIYNDVHDDIENILKRMEEQFSPDSKVIKSINSGTKTEVSNEFLYVLNESIKFSSSYPLFDVTIGALTNLWNISSQAEYCYINSSCTIPNDEAIKEALSHVDFNKIGIDGNYVTLPEGYQLDFGAIVKGYASDLIKEYLINKGYSFFVINLGGNVITHGESLTYKERGLDLSVSVENPFDGDYPTVLDIITKDEAIVTSGIDKRYITIDGVKYHHILDASTGYPASSDIEQVTIAASTGILADMMSTLCLIVGFEKSVEIIKANNLRAVILTKDAHIHVVGNLPIINNYKFEIDNV